jgi:phosphate uptake regulator
MEELPVRRRFLYFMECIHTDLRRLAQQVTQMLARMISSLECGNVTVMRWVLDQQPLVHSRRRELEHEVFKLLATQQPIVAFDLRYILAMMHLALELERTADAITLIMRHVTQLLAEHASLPLPNGSDELFQIVQQMLGTSLQAFEDRNLETAYSLATAMQWVRACESRLQAALTVAMTMDPQGAELHLMLEQIILSLVAIAHHATVISERVIYMLTCTTVDLIHAPPPQP